MLGLNSGAMGFYGEQGREDPNFQVPSNRPIPALSSYSYYCSYSNEREDPHFQDRNQEVFTKLQSAHPTVSWLAAVMPRCHYSPLFYSIPFFCPVVLRYYYCIIIIY